MIFVDTNILLDVVQQNPLWGSWSLRQMIALGNVNTLIINPIIYSEFSISFNTLGEVEQSVEEMGLIVEALPNEVSFLAGKAYVQYRRLGGTKANVLSDFFIGAHAVVRSAPLLTRDARRYRTYFPSLRLITPYPEG